MLVEGQSEEIFVKTVLAPHLLRYGVFVHPPVVLWTKRLPGGGGFRGGVSTWNLIRRNLLPLMNDSGAWVTTLIDFYNLPADFPGWANVREEAVPQQRVVVLENCMKREFSHRRFIPFLALHEFEAWVFSRPDVVETHFGINGLAEKIRGIAEGAGGPELINQGVSTHPKVRLKSLVTRYKETSDGPTVLEKTGISAVRGACPHFHQWLCSLENTGHGVSGGLRGPSGHGL
jgi:hypothetical protein